MKNKKSRTEYLNYIEDTTIHLDKLNNVASRATKNARKRALEKGEYVTYLVGNKIVKEYPSGYITTLKTLQESSIQVLEDGRFEISER